MYKRLQDSGATKNDFQKGTLDHIPHKTRNTDQDNSKFPSVNDNILAQLKTLYNKEIIKSLSDWSSLDNPIINVSINKENDNYFTGIVQSRTITKIDDQIHDAALRNAMLRIIDNYFKYVNANFLISNSTKEISNFFSLVFNDENSPVKYGYNGIIQQY